MVVCSHCGRESRAADRFCQYCGQQLDPGNGHLVAALAPHYVGANGESAEWQGPLAEAASASSSAQHSSQDVSSTPSQMPGRARLIVRQVPETTVEHHSVPGAAGREYQLDGGDVAIGRAPSCDVVLEGDQLASRRHALLRRKDDVYTVVDLGSSNGTYVNDLEIREATTLKDGDVITIGAHEIVFSTAPASPHASIPGTAVAGIPVAPLGETDPSTSAVNAPLVSAPAVPEVAGEWPAPDGADVASPEAAAADADAQPLSSDIALSPDLHASDQAESDMPGAGAGATAVERNVENVPVEEAGPEEAAGSDGSFAVALMPAHGATPVTDLEALRAQLAEISAALARKADEEARAADRLRSTLSEARDCLATLSEQRAKLAEQSTLEDAPAAANVSELVSVARQAAENPRHLDYLTSFAAHASEIAAALESLEAHQANAMPASGNAELLDMLDELRTRLDDALKQG